MNVPPLSRWLIVAALLGALAVSLGAFGAHQLQQTANAWPEENRQRRLDNWDTGARYQLYHALALAGLALYLTWYPSRIGQAAAASLLVGTLIFSGCLYLYTWTGATWWGAIVPIGGVLLIVGWVLWAVAASRSGR